MAGAVVVCVVAFLILAVLLMAATPLVLWLATREPRNRKEPRP